MVVAVVVLTVALRAVRDDSVGFNAGKTGGNELGEFAAVVFDATLDGVWRRHRLEAVAVRSSVAVGECGSEIDGLRGDVLLITFLPIEVDEVFDGAEVGGFIGVGSGVFDVIEGELVLAGGGNRRASTGRRALESLVPVTVCVFVATIRLNELMSEKRFESQLTEKGLRHERAVHRVHELLKRF